MFRKAYALLLSPVSMFLMGDETSDIYIYIIHQRGSPFRRALAQRGSMMPQRDLLTLMTNGPPETGSC